MGEVEVSILEYLGKFELGILVLVSLSIEKEYYEATFYYDQENMVLTISEEMEEKYGDIKKYKQYPLILRSLLEKVVPFNDMYNRLDPVDFSKWIKGIIEVQSQDVPELINQSDIQPLPGT
jgi:hypothetical protein